MEVAITQKLLFQFHGWGKGVKRFVGSSIYTETHWNWLISNSLMRSSGKSSFHCRETFSWCKKNEYHPRRDAPQYHFFFNTFQKGWGQTHVEKKLQIHKGLLAKNCLNWHKKTHKKWKKVTFWFLNVQRPEGGGGHQFIFVALSKLFVCNKLSIVFGCGKSIRCPKKLLSSYECCSIVSFTKQWKNFVDFIIHSQLYNIFHLTTIEWKQERKRKKYFPKQRKYTRSDLKISFRHMSFERMSHQELLEEMNEIEEERLKESPTSCCFSEKCALFLSWPRTNQSWRATFWTGPSSATRGGRCALELYYVISLVHIWWCNRRCPLLNLGFCQQSFFLAASSSYLAVSHFSLRIRTGHGQSFMYQKDQMTI